MSSLASRTPKRPAGASASRAKAPSREAYHHGALREALIEATEALLAERGPEGFSLREVARRSGVSPAAPAHHFGDAQGLLGAVATLAFDGLTEALRDGEARAGDDPVARLTGQGLGYVGFALRHPGRFGLMFRAGAAGVRRDEAFKRSASAAFQVLEDGVRRLLGVPSGAALSPAQWRSILSTWSVVHGFAHLALAGQFDGGGPQDPAVADEPCGTGRADRELLMRQLLAPLLEQHVRGLLLTQAGP